jgi:hypothetical protein
MSARPSVYSLSLRDAIRVENPPRAAICSMFDLRMPRASIAAGIDGSRPAALCGIG